jgi:dTDP-4-dehydrorhamnose reductase
MTERTHILVLGANGMLGNAQLRWFAKDPSFKVFGTVRNSSHIKILKKQSPDAILVGGVDLENTDSLLRCINKSKPDVIINCAGIVKQHEDTNDPLSAIPINSLLPHRLAQLAKLSHARLIHFSTDCVFSGARGNYVETDTPDGHDMYARTKHLGEVAYPNSITLRTSLIGHEINSAHSLVDWFLSQKSHVRGYKNAIFSGLPTIEIARVIDEYIIPNSSLSGIYHLSADPISKFDLLTKVAKVYKKDIIIEPDGDLVIDRSLDSSEFRQQTGFEPDSWDEMITKMYDLSRTRR